MEGIITKGIVGFYYVKTGEGTFECRAKGRFRKERMTPLAGDKVQISVNENAENTIDEIFPRKNALRRPPVANIDALFIVASTVQPVPNMLLIDRLTVICSRHEIEPIIVLSKADLESADELIEIYSKTPYTLLFNTDIEKIKSLIKGRLCAFTGNSGVGKSTLLNSLDPSLNLDTNEISQKLGRGKHTTRQAEIFFSCGGMIIDTAGFSSLNFEGDELIEPEQLQFYFPEFEQFITSCRFTGCAHVNDSGCKIRQAAQNGIISPSRFESYVYLFNEAKRCCAPNANGKQR